MVKYDINEVTKKSNEGKAVVEAFFTQKEGTVYAICPNWPGKTFTIKQVTPSEKTQITMLGVDSPLSWKKTDAGIEIECPDLSPGEAPCDYAYTFKLTSLQ